MKGLVFDIKQLAIFDGPGIRTTVFMKGCPMRCKWCHNPEGLEFKPQLMVSSNGCLHCNRCVEVCKHHDNCIVCGKCIDVCPLHLRKISGTYYESSELAELLKKDKKIYEMNEGGVTVSGGEPTAQPEFLIELLTKLDGVHRAIETSAFCEQSVFMEILKHLDYVMMDIKLVDPKKHREWTGCDNGRILENLNTLKASGIPFKIRIPLIPGVNDDPDNIRATALLLNGSETLEKVELLPYHTTAGAKYSMVGKEYNPGFDITKKPETHLEIFEKYGIRAEIA